MIDTHAHLDFSLFDKDREEVIQRAFESGVEKIINVGADLKGSEASVKLAGKYKNIFATVGVHPHDVGEMEQEDNKAKKQENKKTIEILKALAYYPEIDSGSHENYNKIPLTPRRRLGLRSHFGEGSHSLALPRAAGIAFGDARLKPMATRGWRRTTFSKGGKMLKQKKVVAIGEIGLDYFKSTTPRDLQIKWFVSQLDLAKELDLPVIIHCRDAHDDVKKILQSKIPLNPRAVGSAFVATSAKEAIAFGDVRPFPKGEIEKTPSPKGEIEKTSISKGKIRGVIHCFSGSLDDAEFYINLGFYISFTGVITYTAEYDEVIKNIPLDKILIETDCPFLAPVPMRGKRNEPAFVKYAAQKIADIRNISFSEAEKETTNNAVKLFAL